MQTTRGASLNDAPSPAAVGTRRRVLLLVAVAVVVWSVDQVTKVVAVRELAGRDPIALIDGILSLRLVRNPGAAFGIAGGMTALFSVIAAVVVVVIVRVARTIGSGWWALALGLMLGGALGNLTDRLFRSPGPLRGHVIDFLELPNWPVFNVADMAIVSGAALMVLLSLRGIEPEGRRAAKNGSS